MGIPYVRKERKETIINADSISVVVIDDNLHSLELISAALSLPGLRIFTASRPEEGLTLISLHQPEIVITDLVMPGMSGFEVLRRTKELGPEIGVLIISVLDSCELRAQALQLGAADYLQKPVSLAVLRKTVERMIQNRMSGHPKLPGFANSPHAHI